MIKQEENRLYYLKHKEYFREFGKTRDKEKHREIRKRWYENNKESVNKKNYKSFKQWRADNPLKAKAQWTRRRLRESGLKGETVQLVYEDNIKKYGTLTCIYCVEAIKFGNDNLEHKQPLSKGGTNDYDNLAVACQRCNFMKHDKTEKEFRSIIE